MKNTIWIITLALIAAPLSVCATSAENALEAKPVSIMMFKNGVGLVVSEISLPKQGEKFIVYPLPEPTLGGFWLSWPENIHLSDIRATQARVKNPQPAVNLFELLEANEGKQVDLQIDDAWQRFKILQIPKRSEQPIQPMQDNIIPPPNPPQRGELIILLDDKENVHGIKLSDIQSIRFLSQDYNLEIEQSTIQNRLAFNAESREEAANVSMTYLAKGIAWSPSYVVDISDEDKARLVAKAVIVNDLIPLKDVSVDLIAGFPHIQFSEVQSTFSLTPLQQIFDRLSQSRRESSRNRLNFSNVMTQQVSFARAPSGAPMPSAPLDPVAGEGEEDLYFYELDNVTLKKGERGYFPLFKEEVDYEHIFTWTIQNTIDENTRYNHQNEEQEPPQEVWHSIKLTNPSDNPWTTAPATTMKNGRILGQDTLFFTPGKASSELKITQAVSVQAEHNEYEVERQRNAATFYNYRYDLVTVKGELELTNYKDKSISVKITKNLSGEVLEADADPTITKLARQLRSVNPESQIIWTKEVEPGKDNNVMLEYKYRLYVRN